jgi:hypothetical protein
MATAEIVDQLTILWNSKPPSSWTFYGGDSPCPGTASDFQAKNRIRIPSSPRLQKEGLFAGYKLIEFCPGDGPL